MQVRLAQEMGLCFGVRRAIQLVDRLVADGQRVAILGPLVHNPQVLASLKARGVETVDSIDEVRGGTVVVPSHGAPPEVFEAARSKGLDVVDATCPHVKLAQRAAKTLAGAGFDVIVMGDRSHTEVRGIIGWASGRVHVVSGPSELDNLSLGDKVGVLAQTTQPEEKLQAVAKAVVDRLSGLREVRVVNTICRATAVRQAAAAELADEADVILVVGGRTSANTRRLVEICRQRGVEAHQIEDADEVERAWLIGRKTIGVTAGASTPDEVVQSVVERVLALGD